MKYQEIRKEEKLALAAHSRKFTGKYKGLVSQILRELSKDYPIKELKMGMGGFSLSGGELVVCDPGEREAGSWGVNLNELVEHADEKHGYGHEVIGFTDRHRILLKEFNEIMEHLCDPATPLGLFDLKAPF